MMDVVVVVVVVVGLVWLVVVGLAWFGWLVDVCLLLSLLLLSSFVVPVSGVAG
jgi:hypothetical protein